jgi:hypothetical protein
MGRVAGKAVMRISRPERLAQRSLNGVAESWRMAQSEDIARFGRVVLIREGPFLAGSDPVWRLTA